VRGHNPIASREPATATVEDLLRAASPLVERVLVSTHQGGAGVAVEIGLSPLLVRMRAAEQGLVDDSVEAAAASPRVEQAIADAIERVNVDLPPEERIREHRIADR
jgi:hypothetical protein